MLRGEPYTETVEIHTLQTLRLHVPLSDLSPLKRNGSVSFESTLDCDCKDLNSNSGYKSDKIKIVAGRCVGPARTEFLLSVREDQSIADNP